MNDLTLETIGLKALIYCQTANRARFLSSSTGEALAFTKEQAHHYDVMASVMEKELFELCEEYQHKAQENRDARNSQT